LFERVGETLSMTAARPGPSAFPPPEVVGNVTDRTLDCGAHLRIKRAADPNGAVRVADERQGAPFALDVEPLGSVVGIASGDPVSDVSGKQVD
jgi:hypothetical protein